MSKISFDVLGENQREALKQLQPFAAYGVLAGGTALAMQLRHRRSYDFDIFVPKPLSRQFAYKVRTHFQKIELIIDTGDELTFIPPLGVKVSFIFYPFSALYDNISTEYFRIADWRDITVDKAHTVGRRGAWRDYVDLYFCIKHGFALKEIMKEAQRKFGDLFSEKLFLSQLCYLEDIKDFSAEFLQEKVTPRKLQQFFEKEIEKMQFFE